MVHVLGALFSVAAGVLLWAGVAKALRPAGAAGALASAGLPNRSWMVRTLGTGEALVGAACLLRPQMATAAAMALLYLGFSLFLGLLLVRSVPAASCGCLGERQLPPSVLHLVLNLAAAGVAGGVAALRSGVPSVLSQARATPGAGAPYLAALAAVGILAAAAVVYLPELARAWRRAGPVSE